MNYEEICKYVFEQEKIDWSIHDSKKRDRELVFARQLSMYLGNVFYPKETWAFLASIFGKEHATSIHSIKTVMNLMDSDSKVKRKVWDYTRYIKSKLEETKELEFKSICLLKNEETLTALISTIDKMELIARIYCEITNNKIVQA